LTLPQKKVKKQSYEIKDEHLFWNLGI